MTNGRPLERPNIAGKAFGWMGLGEIEVYATDQRDDAAKWVSN